MPDFFAVVDDLVRRAGVVVERHRGSAHPRFPAEEETVERFLRGTLRLGVHRLGVRRLARP